ncbi:hypothetical protein BIHU0010003c01_00029 [Bifidobacterium phage BitterVaud1]|nr:hypothetical protein BIHU0010003c01_00029 [Bifidobacterium phage BitterVaud1]
MVSYLDRGGAAYLVKKMLDRIYPVGSIYLSTVSTSPAAIYGGQWERYASGKAIFGALDDDPDYAPGKVSGSKTNVIDLSKENIGSRLFMRSDGYIWFETKTLQNKPINYASHASNLGINWNDRLWGSNERTVIDGDLRVPMKPPAIAVYAWRRVS